MSTHVRPASPADLAAIDAVHRAAFPTDLEARLVALLIERSKATISLVAEQGGQVVGHVLFSPATVGPPCRSGPELPTDVALADPGPAQRSGPTGLGLAPVAVLPAFQNQGLGSALVRAGLAECRRLANVGPPCRGGPELPTDAALADPSPAQRSGPTWVVVLGHETYYPRFGFAPARRWNLTCDYGDTDAFQFLPLTAAADALRGGHIRYAPEFGELFGSAH